MNGTVLFVDDEEHILQSVRRLFVDNGLEVLLATGGEEAIRCFETRDIDVIVTDYLMPGMKGVELLSRIKVISPDTVRILMTAHADLTMAIEAINLGEVFKFITKPWDNDLFVATVEEGISRHQVIRSLRNADEATLLSLATTIELKDPYTRGHCDRVARFALSVAEALGLPEPLCKDIRHGSWLHDCGKIGVPEWILNHPGKLDENRLQIIRRHPLWGADVARQARLSQRIVNIILHHHERFDGQGYPSGLRSDAIPLEARIVTVADIYDALTTDRPYRKGYPFDEALTMVSSMREKELDPEIADIFIALIAKPAIPATAEGN